MKLKQTMTIIGGLIAMAFASQSFALPSVKILATGGTIAGVAQKSADVTGYKAGSLGIDTLIQAVPQMKDYAEVSGEQVANISSNNVDTKLLLHLANRVNELLADPTIDGVVITHGTDSIEETAFFLNLTVKSDKPVVLVGAMRPATAISADGPMNLLEAVQAAASPKMKGVGVTIVMNDRICAARETTKFNTSNVSTFQAPEYGYLGVMSKAQPVLYRLSTRRHTAASEFDVKGLETLPRVDVVYALPGDDARMPEAALKNGAKGIVSASMGNGSIPNAHKDFYVPLMQKGYPVVLSERVPTGDCVLSGEDEAKGYIAAGNLNPQKSRLLLQLALTKTTDPKEIQRIFNEY